MISKFPPVFLHADDLCLTCMFADMCTLSNWSARLTEVPMLYLHQKPRPLQVLIMKPGLKSCNNDYVASLELVRMRYSHPVWHACEHLDHDSVHTILHLQGYANTKCRSITCALKGLTELRQRCR